MPGQALILFEDDDLLVVHKPAGLNTHAPSPYAGEGLYEWLRHRTPRWASLGIIHRLDKETSGVLLFAKSPLANRSLTEQFTNRTVTKRYIFLTDRPVPQREFMVKSALVRTGEKYVSRPQHAGGEYAETRFRLVATTEAGSLVEAQPLTGRTHQIRVHAADAGLPVCGDTLYGGTPAARLCLHAAELKCFHPVTGVELNFRAEPNFAADSRRELRDLLIPRKETNAYRLIHGVSDGWPGWYVDRLGDCLHSQSAEVLTTRQQEILDKEKAAGVFHHVLRRAVRGTTPAETTAQRIGGHHPPTFTVEENGCRFEIRFGEGYSIGLFLDQRDNRRRLLTSYVGADFPLTDIDGTGEVLNTFAYTCGFSVCAALAGARTTSVDLSRKYLEWGRHNFALNTIDPAGHEFITGDVFDWLGRFAKKQRRFGVVLLDPPTFSTSKTSGTFQAGKHYGRLVTAALPAVKEGGVLFCSCNAAGLAPAAWLEQIEAAIHKAGRVIVRQHYVPQPIDFPISKAEPAYLKSVWLRIA